MAVLKVRGEGERCKRRLRKRAEKASLPKSKAFILIIIREGGATCTWDRCPWFGARCACTGCGTHAHSAS